MLEVVGMWVCAWVWEWTCVCVGCVCVAVSAITTTAITTTTKTTTTKTTTLVLLSQQRVFAARCKVERRGDMCQRNESYQKLGGKHFFGNILRLIIYTLPSPPLMLETRHSDLSGITVESVVISETTRRSQ